MNRQPLRALRAWLACFFLLTAGHAFAAWPAVDLRGRKINDWAYQLQGAGGAPLSLRTLGATRFDLLVIDYSADGGADAEFTAAEIAALKNSPGGPKTVLAYMSIGEAETYRFYWNPAWTNARGQLTASAPAWLAAEDPQWQGNFKVRYWDPEWQAIIFGNDSAAAGTVGKSYLDRILDAGFDGVYLDIIDAYEYFGPGGDAAERPTAAADMIDFVSALAAYARTTRGKPDFIVMPQNGSDLVRDASEAQLAKYFAAIDAIGAEDTFFYGPLANNNAWRPQLWTLQNLAKFRANGKPVFAIDYVTTPGKLVLFRRACALRGFVPFASVRPLDRVFVNRFQWPD